MIMDKSAKRKTVYSKIRAFLKTNLSIIIVILSYLFFTVYYMGPSVWNCSDTLTGIGDNTAGPIWRFGLEPDQPILGAYQNKTNFPEGENLNSPINVSTLIQSSVFWAGSKAVGPVCTYNLVNILGYMSTALTMFLFIRYLTKKSWIAWLAGYAVAFTPYFQSKIGGHPSYGYTSLLIGMLWLILHIYKRPSIRIGIILGLLLAICAYFDPYFILLAATVAGPAGAVVLIYTIVRERGSKNHHINAVLKAFIGALITLALLLIPLMFVLISKSNEILNYASGQRGSVYAAAMQCSNLPHDYILPDPRNVYLTKVFGDSYEEVLIKVKHWCNYGESRVSLSLTLIFVSILGFILILWDRITREKIKLSKIYAYKPSLIVLVILAVGLAAFTLGLPPKLGSFITPSGLLLKITETWRIFAREYVVLNLILVLAFSMSIAYINEILNKNYQKYLRIAFVLILALLMAEYQINPAFDPPTFSYVRDVPQIYRYIKDRDEIDAIAEFPLDRTGIEADSMVYYLTMQPVHSKKLLNNATPIQDTAVNYIFLKDLTDPQTIPALRRLGIKYVVIHGVSINEIEKNLKNVTILKHEVPPVYSLNIIQKQFAPDITLVKIKEGPAIDTILIPTESYVINKNIQINSLEMEYEMSRGATLKAKSLLPNVSGESFQCFDIKLAANDTNVPMDILVNDKFVYAGLITTEYQTISLNVQPNDIIKIHTKNGANIRLNNIGCVIE